ncbi:MFS transporter [Opitutus sp. GAS368]|jgi:GPH family glycoside/pentoside/hexuronide:cation symporter|uniref:MFS transporter n=1 Tax=Opitutus sp. GAS368 TaxID=1882749 RepID=UPI00087CC979|nr:MFS transporter [Opitutus sp. GAS368]SDS33008.1 glycoside/pentoside/hexuronide:cation symporter, GPH family [Opitutus sp. GAS368]
MAVTPTSTATRTETLPFGQRLAYASGNFASLTTGYGISSLANYVFNIALGVNPALVGLALALPRLLDLFTDPLAGYLSDTYRQQHDRRSFIALGAVVSSGFFALVWLFPDGMSERGYFLWLLLFSCATYTGWSFLSIPWQALGFELTESYHERTRLMAASTFLGGAAGVFYGWSYAATQLKCFTGTINGARWVGGVMAFSILVSGLCTVFFCKEKPLVAIRGGAPTKSKANLGEFFKSLRRVFGSRPFRLLAGAVVFMCLGVFSVSGIGPYIAIYFIHGGDQAHGSLLIGAASTAWQGTSMILAGPLVLLAKRYGKKQALLLFLGLALAGNLLKWVCYTPALPWLFVVPSMFFAAGFTGLWTLTPSMVADVCDFEAEANNWRDSGMFAAFYTWMIKLGSTVAFALGGILINLTGFDVTKGSIQDAPTIFWMRVVDFSLPAVTIVVAMLLVSRFPITEGIMASVRQRLDARAGEDGSSMPVPVAAPR